jgi:hypothetical protein
VPRGPDRFGATGRTLLLIRIKEDSPRTRLAPTGEDTGEPDLQNLGSSSLISTLLRVQATVTAATRAVMISIGVGGSIPRSRTNFMGMRAAKPNCKGWVVGPGPSEGGEPRCWMDQGPVPELTEPPTRSRKRIADLRSDPIPEINIADAPCHQPSNLEPFRVKVLTMSRLKGHRKSLRMLFKFALRSLKHQCCRVSP